MSASSFYLIDGLLTVLGSPQATTSQPNHDGVALVKLPLFKPYSSNFPPIQRIGRRGHFGFSQALVGLQINPEGC